MSIEELHNFFECDESCPFQPEDMEGALYENKTYTVFGDSKCMYKITEQLTKVQNYYIAKNSVDLLIYHSYEHFNIHNTGRRDKNF